MKPRQLIVIEGEQALIQHSAQQLLTHFDLETVLQAPVHIKQVLGKEYTAVVYNTAQGLDPDLLGALGGTIVAGGVLILLCPAFSTWLESTDPFNQRITSWPYQAEDVSNYFLQRFTRLLADNTWVKRLKAGESVLPLHVPTSLSLSHDYRSTEQSQALQKIQLSLTGSDPVCAVISADRGRGKSAFLGQLAKQQIALGQLVAVTAPSRLSAQVVFDHAENDEALSFYPVDGLCQQMPPADLLLVDEAAAIPSHLLKQLLSLYPRIVFATTVHGYEGTGRGFVLRFQHYLDQHYAHWQAFNFTQAIRYASNDPLEDFLFSSLLLNTSPVLGADHKAFSLDDCQIVSLTSAALIANEELLREVFGLLVLAHYQTRPKDLRHLLDGIGVRVVVVCWKNQIVATVLVVREGGFDAVLAKEIYYGKRRPQGHLVPQSLAVHAGIAEAPLFTTDRIMRIVVHPDLQRHGLGSLLLVSIAEQSQADTLSASFGADADLLQFWQKQGYQVVRIGLARDASSGRHAAIMLRANTEQGYALLAASRQQFKDNFPLLLVEPLKRLEISVIKQIMPTQWANKTKETLTDRDKQNLLSYIEGHRQYECCLLAIKKLYFSAQKIGLLMEFDEQTQQLLQAKVEQGQAYSTIVRQCNLQGKKIVQQKLREGVGKLLLKYELGVG